MSDNKDLKSKILLMRQKNFSKVINETNEKNDNEKPENSKISEDETVAKTNKDKACHPNRYIKKTKTKIKKTTVILLNKEFSRKTPSSFDLILALKRVTKRAKGKYSFVLRSTM